MARPLVDVFLRLPKVTVAKLQRLFMEQKPLSNRRKYVGKSNRYLKNNFTKKPLTLFISQFFLSQNINHDDSQFKITALKEYLHCRFFPLNFKLKFINST